jgi:hemoglobin
MIEEPNRPTPYEMIGGADKLRAIVDRFYDLMELDPRYEKLRAAHGATLEHAREKLFMFLSGWLGGPPLYTDKFGHPMLRARHLPFAIGEIERDQWIACMGQALEELEVPEPFRLGLVGNLYKTADWMRNRPG